MQSSTSNVKYRFDFLKYRYIWFVVSLVYLIACIAAYFVMGGFKYHIDFTGGAEISIVMENQVDTAKIRSAVANGGWKEVIIQEMGNSKKEYLIRLGGQIESGLEAKMQKVISESMPDNKLEIRNVQWVGAEVSSDTTWNAIYAVFLSILILLLYIAFRSEFSFGFGAIIALMHDMLFVLAFILITGEQVSLNVLAAILAVLGYSINDTIVIFSRIKENFKKLNGQGVSDYDIVNLSINQTLTRTVLTSFATLLSVLAILFLGGETLRGLSLIMFIGIVVGTYSSIYIASPVMLAVRYYKALRGTK